ncbi:MAG: AAA family ATPase [Parachlamydiales bacterium]|nr:AAA family ATPase [Parachlamydiales bacterium]
MRVKKIKLVGFKRFTDLTIQNIPQTAKVVILVGLNGRGKSSVFDAFYTWYSNICKHSSNWDESYHLKRSHQEKLNSIQAVKIDFHDPLPKEQSELLKVFYLRSPYRNEPEFQVNQFTAIPSALSENRPSRMIDNDATVAQNYKRLVSQGLEDIYEKEDCTTTIGAFREKTIGEIRNAMSAIFPDLSLNSLGNPLTGGTFKFDKGASKSFSYKNLSAGEKAAFDLLLDLIIKGREFDNTVFCIDEPEAHMNTRLQALLFTQLFNLVSKKGQLWLATHSIGIMKCAKDLATKFPDEVVFLDFSGIEFDQPDILVPAVLNRHFWRKIIEMAFDDMADLVAPRRVVICEGKPAGTGGRNPTLDATCYEKIFASEFPDTSFIAGGNSLDVESDRLALAGALKALANGVEVIRLIDGDDHSPGEVEEKGTKGVKILRKRHLESYLFDDEVLKTLCIETHFPEEVDNLIKDKQLALRKSSERGNALDDIKSIAGDIYNAAKKRLKLTKCGNNVTAFMRDTLAPLVKPGTNVYSELREEIFSDYSSLPRKIEAIGSVKTSKSLLSR